MTEKDPFNFKVFVKVSNFTQKTIDYLTGQNLDEEIVLQHLDPSRISTLDLTDGEQIKLQLALDALFDRNRPEITSELGATAKIKIEPGTAFLSDQTPDGQHKTTLSATTQQTIGDTTAATTTSLAKDAQLNLLVKEFLETNQRFSSFKDLLTLSDIKTSVDKGEKPLLIGDFLSSNINVSYYDDEEDVQLGSDAKLVVSKKRKPDIINYTPELWSGASFRILSHLITTGAPSQTLNAYAVYSSMIADYLEIYVHRGVFCLDFEHRHRVAKEGRSWDNISGHDERRFLKFASKQSKYTSDPKDSAKYKRSKGQYQKRNKKVDSNGRPICFNFNLEKGCNYGKACLYSHVCLSCEDNHPQVACKS